MQRTETVRIVATVIILILAFYFLLPTIQKMTMSPEELTTLKNTDRQAYNSLIHKSIKLGLDLQGGLRLVLEPEVTEQAGSSSSNVADQALVIISNRINGMGLTEPDIRKSKSNQIVVEIPGIDSVSVADAKKQISQIAKLEFRFLETPTVTSQTIEKIDALLASKYGGESASDTGSTSNSLNDSTNPAKDGDTAKQTSPVQPVNSNFKETSLSIYLMEADKSSYFIKGNIDKVQKIMALPEVQELVPPKTEFLFSTGPELFNGIYYNRLYLVKKEVVMTGETLENIRPSYDQFRNAEVLFDIRSNWRAKWGSVTGNNLQKPLAIILDGRVESAPTIQNQITTSGRITMRSGATFVEAQQLSNVLKSGSLPTRLLVKEDVIIGPSLGKDSIHSGILSSILGLVLVAALMIFYYRGSGIIATLALLFNIVVLMAVITVLKATLTVPGIAGIVLLVGISVDAEVLIFERIRDELNVGKTVRAAIDAGYTRAGVTIIDSNLTTLIVTVLLYYFGSGPVRGFAITLSIGILISLFSALVVTRMIFEFRKTYKRLSI